MADPRAASLGVIAAVALLTPAIAEARLTRLTIERREPAPPARHGAPAYEILHGWFGGELDPGDPRNRIITDLASAPRNARGRVVYSATFAMARPLAGGSGLLFYDVPNRGMGRVAPDPGGHVRVISGWQGDIAPAIGLQTANVPVATRSGGRPLTGPVLARFVNITPGTASLLIQGGIVRPVARPVPLTLDTRRAHLFWQSRDDRPLVAIAPDDWAFADCALRPFPGRPDPGSLCLKNGFDPARAYTLIYRGRDPKVLGIGFAATRDLVAFLRHAARDDFGNDNPLGSIVRWTVASGTSQAGNYLKSFVHLGFNADERGKRVFDGINPNIAARQVPLNIRFGVPGGAADLFEPGSEGSLWWSRYDDRARRRGASSLLDRCTATRTCPRIVETFGSAELWGLRMSPALVGTDAHGDVPIPANVRRYYFPGVSHGGSRDSGFAPATPIADLNGLRCVMPGNPNPIAATLRALQRALVEWVMEDRAPPPSRYPRLATGELVAPTARAMGWPAIPGAPTPEGRINVLLDQDFGPGLNHVDLSGVVTRQPPRFRGVIPALVPRLDADGNELGGVASVQMRVPLGTYTGWNARVEGYGAGGGCGFFGGFIPFARTRGERLAAGDPRPSLQERYGDHRGFVDHVRREVAVQMIDRLLLPEDGDKLIAAAEASTVLPD